MGQYISKGLGSVLVGALLAFLIAGCGSSGGTSGAGTSGGGTSGGQTPTVVIGQGAGDTLPPSVTNITNPNPGTFQPVGNIQGVVRDAVTGLPINGAQVSISIPGASVFVTTVTTGASGQYSFANVPASGWSDGSGGPADGIVQFAELTAYTVTVNMAAVDAALPGSAAKYPEAAFGQAVVGFANFADGNNPLLCASPPVLPPAVPGPTHTCTEGGSGASTPVSGLTTTLNFDIGRMTEAIRGKVKDAQNGLAIANATVTLLDAAVTLTPTPTPGPAAGPAAGGIRLSLNNTTVTTASDGTFTFPSVPAAHCFNVEAQAPGYTESGTLTIVGIAPVCTKGGGLTALVPATPASLGDLDGSGTIVCPAECLGAPGAGEIMLAPVVPGVDVVPPYVAQADPADGADIDVTTATGNPKRPIKLTFSEPMQTDNGFTRPIVATVDFKGLPIPGPGVSGPDGVVETRTDWSNNGTVLTITPINNWQAGLTYGVFVGAKPVPLTPTAPLVDISGNPCCRCIPQNALGSTSVLVPPLAVCSGPPAPVSVGAVLGEVNPTPTTLLFTTNNGPKPIDGPANVKLGPNSADFNQSTATIQWDPKDGARAYEVHMSINGGDFQLIARTLPGNSPVTQLLSRSWSFDDALNVATPGTVGVNPGACTGAPAPAADPCRSTTNPTPRVSPGFEILAAGRRVLEGFIADVGDDVSAAPPVDVADGFADLSDGFGSAAQVRIAIATVNSNGVIGTLSSPVTVKDNSGPTTNGTAPAGSTPLPPCSLAAPCPPPPTPGHFNPIATTWRGQVVQDLFTGTTLAPDGIPDTILIGLSEPLAAGTATCNINATPPVPCTQYTLRQQDGTVPDRLKTSAITIVSATYDETPGNDTNGNGVIDKGSDVDGNGIKGNSFGNAFVWLRIQAVTAGGPVDIRKGDFVDITGVQDLAGNVNRTVDQSLPQNQLADINLPQVVSAVATNNPTGTPDTIVVTFSEPLGAFPLAGLFLRIAQVNCAAIPGVVTVNPAFKAGDSSVTLQVNAPATSPCDVSRLAGNGTNTSDFIAFGAVTDLAGNPLLSKRNALLFSGTFTAVPPGTFTVTSTAAIVALLADTTAPQLSSVATGAGNTLTLTFNERIGTIVAAANVAVTTTTRTVACTVANGGITGATFVQGDTQIKLTLSGAGGCSVGAMATTDLVALGFPTVPLGAPAPFPASQFVTDLAGPPPAPGNPLDNAFDHAVLQADGTFKIQAAP